MVSHAMSEYSLLSFSSGDTMAADYQIPKRLHALNTRNIGNSYCEFFYIFLEPLYLYQRKTKCSDILDPVPAEPFPHKYILGSLYNFFHCCSER